MNDFFFWFKTGLLHIADIHAYDHMLFLLALCGVYELKHWKTLTIQATAFTVGHSLTLAFTILGWLSVSSQWVEFLIPCTIMATIIIHTAYRLQAPKGKQAILQYVITLIFGCIHGLGFSVLLKSLLGHQSSLVLPLAGFNVGLEIGQIIIITCILLVGFMIGLGGKKITLMWKIAVHTIAFFIALWMAIDRL